MKKKNFMSWMTIMMMVMLGVGFAACSSDDSDDEGEGTPLNLEEITAEDVKSVLVSGVWTVHREYFPNYYRNDYDGSMITSNGTWTFDKNGSFFRTLVDDHDGETKTSKGTYRIQNRDSWYLILNESEELAVEKLSTNSFVLSDHRNYLSKVTYTGRKK